MKTIIENATDLSHYIYEDSLQVVIGEKTLTIFTENIGDIVETNTIIDKIDPSNYFLVEDVTPPEDWASNKYMYADSEWALNPDWVEPEDTEN
jgi:hypothetical protein